MSQSFDASLDAAALQRGMSIEGPRDPYSIMRGAYDRLLLHRAAGGDAAAAALHHDYITHALAKYALLRRRQSSDRSSRSGSRASRADSSWDEVESIDFGGSHEMDLDPFWFLPPDPRSPGYGSEASSRAASRTNSNSLLPGSGDAAAAAAAGPRPREPGSPSREGGSPKPRRRGRDLIVPDEEDQNQFSFSGRSLKPEKSVDRESSSSERSGGGAGGAGRPWRMDRRLVDQLLRYKAVLPSNHSNSPTDSVSTASSYPASYGSGEAAAGKLPYENDYEYMVRMRRVSQGSLASGVSGHSGSGGHRSALGSRTESIDSNFSSLGEVGTPDYPPGFPSGVSPGMGAPPAAAMRHVGAPAEDVLMNLGFVGGDSFIPERFARNWYDKVMVARHRQMEVLQQQEIADMLEGLDSPSRGHSGKASPSRHQTNKSDFLHRLDINSRNSSIRRNKFRRAATIMTYHGDGRNVAQALSSQASFDDDPDDNVQRQDSIDQLKSILERQASILNLGIDQGTRERKRKQFAGSRQKSLPLALETLSEEEEGRLSKGASFEKSRKKSQEDGKSSRSSSKESENKEKQRGSIGSDSSAFPNSLSSAATSADDSEAETSDSKPDLSKLGAFSSERPRADITQTLHLDRGSLPATPLHSAGVNVFNVMPLLQRQASLDNIHLGSYPAQLRAPPLSMISEAPDLPVYQTPMLTKPEVTKSHSVPARTVPAIVVSSHRFLEAQSSSSLEIADIFDRRSSQGDESLSEDEPVPGGGSRRGSAASDRGSPKLKTPGLKVEPAMLSLNVVSLDTEEPPSGERRSSLSMLLAPSPSHSMLTSPIPVSPVTVIEMEHLDNQDSMDSGDSAPHSLHGDSTPSQLLLSPEMPDSLHPIAEEEIHSSDQSRSTSFDEVTSYLSDTAFSLYSSAKNSFDEQSPSLKDSGIVADDGKLSPIALFPSGGAPSGGGGAVTFTSQLDADTLKEAMNSRSDSFQSAQESTGSSDERRRQLSVETASSDDKRRVELDEPWGAPPSPRETRDAAVQGDDGALSPIMFNPALYDADYRPSDDVYYACDKGTQHGSDVTTLVSAASQTTFQFLDAHERSLSFQSRFSKEDSFDPTYYLNSSSQTDITGEVHSKVEVNSPDPITVKFQSSPHFQLLCKNCGKTVKMSNSSTSTEFTSRDLPSTSSHNQSHSLASLESSDANFSVDSPSVGKKALDTIIERLSRKTDVIRQRSRTSTSSVESFRGISFLPQGEQRRENSDRDKDGTANESTKNPESKGNGTARNPPRPHTFYQRSTSDNFEDRLRSKAVASLKASDSRSSSPGPASAPASQNISRHMSTDSRRSSTGAGNSGSRRGSLVRQHCIELSTVLLNMQDIHSRDLESDEDEDVFLTSASREATSGFNSNGVGTTSGPRSYVESLKQERAESPRVRESQPHPLLPSQEGPTHQTQKTQHKMAAYTRGFHHQDPYLVDLDRMPSRFQKQRVRVQKKSKLKTKYSYPHLSSRSTSTLGSSSVGSSASRDSVEREHMAQSIATNLFQTIGVRPGLSKRQILDEIAMDYLVMKAVNRTLDQLFSSGESLDAGASAASAFQRPAKLQQTQQASISPSPPPPRKISAASDRSDFRMTSADSSDASSELSHRGRDAFLKSAPEVGEAFSRLATWEDEQYSRTALLPSFSAPINFLPDPGPPDPGGGGGPAAPRGKRPAAPGLEWPEDGAVGSDSRKNKSPDSSTRDTASKQTSSTSSVDGEAARGRAFVLCCDAGCTLSPSHCMGLRCTLHKPMTPQPHRVCQRITHHAPCVWGWNPSAIMVAHTHFSVNTTILVDI